MFILNLILFKCSLDLESFVDDQDIGSSILTNLKKRLANFDSRSENINGVIALYVKCKESDTSMPDDICILKNMSTLHFNNSGISQLSLNFVNLKKLIRLNLSSNKFTTIPTEIFSILELIELNLSNNLLETISDEIVKLEQLNSLDVSRNKLENIPNCLYLLKNLKDLKFNKNYCREIRYYKKWFQIRKKILQMETLEVLEVEDNFIKDISTGFIPPKLGILRISNNMLKSLPRSLSKWTNLEELYIIGNKFIGFPSIILYIASLKILSLECIKIKKELNLCNNIVSELTDINLIIDRIDQTKPLEIKSNHLKKLSLTVKEKGGLNLSRFICPKSEHLTLSNDSFENATDFKDNELLEIQLDNLYAIKTVCCNLNHLKVFRIDIISYQDEDMEIPILKGLEGSEYLEEFRLSGASLNEFPSEILNFSNLKQINLSHNKISKIPDNINQLQKLEYLNMTDNNLSEINRRLFGMKTLKQVTVCGNNIKYLPKEYKMVRSDIILFDAYNLHLTICGDDLGFLDLSEKYLRNVKSPNLFLGDYNNVFKTYDFIETESIYWNLEKVLSIKLDEIKKPQEDFKYLNNIWTTYLLQNIENKDLLEVWDYINTIYKVPNSTFRMGSLGFMVGIDDVKYYIENIFNMLKSHAIRGKKDIISDVFTIIKSGIKNNFDRQLEILRIVFLSLNNDYDENLTITKLINNVLANIKENCLRKVTSFNSDFQDHHIFSYWKDKLHEELGCTKSERVYVSFPGSLEIYQTKGYILYRFFKEFRPEAVIKEMLEIINNNNEMVVKIRKNILNKHESDLSKIEYFFEHKGKIEDGNIHKITFEGLLYILKDLELIVEKDKP